VAGLLQVKLLGKFEVRVNGQPVEIQMRAAQSLLAYLMLNAGTPHRREQLAGLFWPDRIDTKARHNLRQILWRLRKVIGEKYLTADDLTVAFDAAADYWLDAQVLDRKIEASTSTADLIAAVSVYGGEPLPGFYDEWVLLERERLQAAFNSKMTVLIDRLIEAQRWDEVMKWGERWITVEHSPEAAYRALIIAYGARGDASQAAAAYQRCEEALRRDLGVEPSLQTRAALKRAKREAATAIDLLSQRPRTNLPASLASFIGREKELTEVRGLITMQRAVTLTGSGGAGKTRLAIESASGLVDHFADGVWLIEFAPLTDAALIPHAVAATLGLLETGGRSIVTALIDVLHEKHRLLIFDNCEHLIDACAQLATMLLPACPQLHILATSREPLGIAGEMPFRVPPLSTPDAQHLPIIQELEHYEAVQLFVERGAAAIPAYALTADNAVAIAHICQRLDGMPLAIELAAARLKTLRAEEIAMRLDDRFRLLTGGSRMALPRQQTLRATIEWSYNLLPEAERVLLQRLSVFAGGWTLEAAEFIGADFIVGTDPDVGADPRVGPGGNALDGSGVDTRIDPYNVLDLLTRLADKSLVNADRAQGQETRYRMLETIRQFAREKLLESGGDEAIRDRHLDYYLRAANRMKPELFGPKELIWLTWLEHEWDNLRAAMGWSLDKRPDAGLALVNCLGDFLVDTLTHMSDLDSWLSRLIPHPVNSARTAARAQGLYLWAWCVDAYQEDIPSAPILKESISIYEELGDKNGLARTLFMQANSSADPQTNFEQFQKALNLFRETDDQPWMARTLRYMGWQLASLESAHRLAYLTDSLALYRELGCITGIMESLKQLGALEVRLGHFETAHRWLDEGFAILQNHASSLGTSQTMSYDLGDLAFYEGHDELAQKYYEDCLRWADQTGFPYSVMWAKIRLGYVLSRRGKRQEAHQHLCEALLFFERANYRIGVIVALEGLANLAVVEHRWEKAITLNACATNLRESIQFPRMPVEETSVDRDLAVIHAELDDDAFQAEQAAGRTMTLDEAIEYALREEVVNLKE
jgi:predicted ATPase/DNA-binding SARP family transcriptional activator